MSADVLREAAAAMSHIAERATPGRWKLWGMTVMADQDGTSNVETAVEVAQTFFQNEQGKPRTWDASHIAGMHPAVALAVADLLERIADQYATFVAAMEMGGTNLSETAIANQVNLTGALAVARAYLGTAA